MYDVKSSDRLTNCVRDARKSSCNTLPTLLQFVTLFSAGGNTGKLFFFKVITVVIQNSWGFFFFLFYKFSLYMKIFLFMILIYRVRYV